MPADRSRITPAGNWHCSHRLVMNRESKQLKKYREKWVGKAVAYRDEPMEVVGVGDDGAQCDYDQRRKYKPTGTLFVRDRYGAEHSAPEVGFSS